MGSTRKGASRVPARAPRKVAAVVDAVIERAAGTTADDRKNYKGGGKTYMGKLTRNPWKIYRVAQASAGVREGAKRRRLALLPAIGHDAERLDETLPAARERDRHPQIDELIFREVRAELAVERGIDDRMLTREPVRQAQRRLRALRQVGAFVVGELRDQVLRRASAHRRGGAREASVHALVVPRELDADQLEQLGLDARPAAIDVANESPRRVEQTRPARHREEQVVVLVGVAIPPAQHAPELVAELLAPRLRDQTALVGHGLLPALPSGIQCRRNGVNDPYRGLARRARGGGRLSDTSGRPRGSEPRARARGLGGRSRLAHRDRRTPRGRRSSDLARGERLPAGGAGGDRV